jgi:hypothetical protein
MDGMHWPNTSELNAKVYLLIRGSHSSMGIAAGAKCQQHGNAQHACRFMTVRCQQQALASSEAGEQHCYGATIVAGSPCCTYQNKTIFRMCTITSEDLIACCMSDDKSLMSCVKNLLFHIPECLTRRGWRHTNVCVGTLDKHTASALCTNKQRQALPSKLCA